MVARISSRHRPVRTLAFLAAGVLATALAVPTAAAATPLAAAGLLAGTEPATGFAPNVESIAIATLARSTGLTGSQARQRLAEQHLAGALGDRLGAALGERAAGFYLDHATGRPVVDVVDSAAAGTVLAAGATPKLVAHSASALRAASAQLDALPAVANTAYGVDPVSNRVVVTVSRGADQAGVSRLLGAVKNLGDTASVRYSAGVLSKQIANGDEISTGVIICSAGFNVNNGGQDYLLDAGHCTQGLPDWSGVGPSVDSKFPGTDYGLIRNDAGNSAGVVDTYDGNSQTITQAGAATVGENVCKSGRTTFVTCGSVSAVDQTVNYSDGLGGVQTVHGLIQTTVHCDHGDSGGPLYDGQTGLGMVSGGDGTTDYFQPLPAALAAYGLTLN